MQNITYLNVEDSGTRTDAAAWARFTAPASEAELFAGWLAITTARIGHVRAALLLTLDPETQSYTVAAGWPGLEHDLRHLGPLAQQVLEQRSALIAEPDGSGSVGPGGTAHIGCPLDSAHGLHGVVVVELEPRGAAQLQQALRELHWGSGWLIDHFRQLQMQQLDADFARAELLNDVLATAMDHPLRQTSATAVVNELTSRLGCDRVSAGFAAGGQVTPAVLSNTATFDARSDLARWIGEAMDEVLDLGVELSHPAPAEDEFGALAHAESARRLAIDAILSVPVRAESQTIGVLTFERSSGPAFTGREIELASAVGAMLGPVWALQHSRERSTAARLLDASRDAVRGLFGPTRPGLKLLGVTLALVVVLLAVWKVDYRVPGRAVVEGASQLAAVAPFDGFIAAAHARAGDSVQQGQVLARLDPRDLQLERTRRLAEREQLLRRYRLAQAAADRGEMGVLGAQINQAEAQLSLAEEKLSRASVTAPYDGIIVSGDLSQEIGSPVQIGRVLFEVAPRSAYRVMLEIDDRDIVRLAMGQTGRLVLSGLPGQELTIAIRRITPVATQRDGSNLFKVEAELSGPAPTGLRPGMEGVGKIGVGEQSLLWVWSHRFTDWLRLSVWSWLP